MCPNRPAGPDETPAPTDSTLFEDDDVPLTRAAAEEIVAGWPQVRRSEPPMLAVLRPRLRLSVRGEWVQSGLAMYRYEFRVSARRHFLGSVTDVAIDRLTLHWLFDTGGLTVRIGHRTAGRASSLEKHWIFDRRLVRALAFAEGWHGKEFYRSGLAALE